MIESIFNSVAYRIITIKIWVIYLWIGFMAGLSLIVLFSGQYTTDLYYGTMINIGAPIGAYIFIQHYKKKYNFI
jgi:hypothetical protein